MKIHQNHQYYSHQKSHHYHQISLEYLLLLQVHWCFDRFILQLKPLQNINFQVKNQPPKINLIILA